MIGRPRRPNINDNVVLCVLNILTVKGRMRLGLQRLRGDIERVAS